jgi:hypothetical protein
MVAAMAHDDAMDLAQLRDRVRALDERVATLGRHL